MSSLVGTNLSVSGNSSLTGNLTVNGQTTGTTANYSGNLSCNNLSCNANIINTTGSILTNTITSTYIDCDNIQNVNNSDIGNLFLGNTGGILIGNPFSSNPVTISPPFQCNTLLPTNNTTPINIGSLTNSNNIILNQNLTTSKAINSTSTITTNQVNSSNYEPVNLSDTINLFTNSITGPINLGNSGNTNQITINQPTFCANLGATNLYLFSNIIGLTSINGNTLIQKSNSNIAFNINSTQCMFITFTGLFYQIQCNVPILVDNIQGLNPGDAISLYTNNSSSNFNIGNLANSNNIVFNQNISIPASPVLSYSTLPTLTSAQPGYIKYFPITNFSPTITSGTVYKTSSAISLPVGVWAINYYSSLLVTSGSYTIMSISTAFSINGSSAYNDSGFGSGSAIVSGFFNISTSSLTPLILEGSYYFNNTSTSNCYIISQVYFSGSPSLNFNLYGQAVRIA